MIISPAKKMRVDQEYLAYQDLPRFLKEAERLMGQLRQMDASALQTLWKCNDALARENIQRLQRMELYHDLTPAILAYDGIQYRYLAPNVLEEGALAYLQAHLRILSGFYGLLRPLDGVTPYRLEMQAKLAVGEARDLYAFWGEKLGAALGAETDQVLNLASREYSRAVLPHLPRHVAWVECVFGQVIDGKVVEKGTLCKMARGSMARWLAQTQAQDLEAAKEFCQLGYAYDPDRSTEKTYVFIKGGESC